MSLHYKFHPDYQYKNRQSNQNEKADIIQELEFLKKQKNVIIFEPSEQVNISALLNSLSTVITVRGTVGIEAALLGKRVLVFGTGRYSNYGFTKLVKSINELKTDLKKYQGRSKYSSDVSKRAALFWEELYDNTPIDLSEFVDFFSLDESVKHPLKINYRIKKFIRSKSLPEEKLLKIVK